MDLPESLRLLVDRSPDPLALLDRELRLVAYSDGWARTHGLDPTEDLRGRAANDLFPALAGVWADALDSFLHGAEGPVLSGPDERGLQARDVLSPWHVAADTVGGVLVRTRQVEDDEPTPTAGLLAVARNAAAVVWAFDADGRQTLSVGAPLRALGQEEGWNVGEPIAEAYAHLPAVVEGVAAVLDGDHRSWTVTVGGRTFETVASPVTDASGAVTGGVAISLDVTERNDARARAESQIRRLRRLYEAATASGGFRERAQALLSELVELLDLEIGLLSRIDVSSDHYEVVAAVAPEGSAVAVGDEFALGKTYCAMTVQAGEVVDIDHMAASGYEGHPAYDTFQLESYIGAPVFVMGEPFGTLSLSAGRPRTAPFGEADRDLVRLAAQWMGGLVEADLRECRLREAADALAAARDEAEAHQLLLRTVIDSLPDLIYVNDRDGKNITRNAASYRMLGYESPEEGAGTTVFDVLPEPEASADWAQQQQVLEKGEPVSDERTVVIAGEAREFESQKVPLRDPEGTIQGVIGILRDVTAQKRAEADLVAAKEAAEAATRAKSAFLAAMSHEIRTPMHAVVGFGDMLATTDLDSEQRQSVQAIQRSGARLLALIDDILDFSRVESGRMELHEEPVALAELVRSTLEELLSAAEERGNTLTFSFDPGLPAHVAIDGKRLQQVLANLVANAVKFTQDGAVDVAIRRHKGADAKPALVIEVRDTGIGIPADRLDSVFDAFVQGDGSVTRAFGGTGLGLAISRRFVELMGGELDVESVEGEGSIFRARLPLRATEAPAPRPTRPQPVAPAEEPDPADVVPFALGLRVLLVEDEPDNQTLALRMLRRLGYVPDVASDGREALDRIREADYDLVFMDLMMPEVDGLEVTRRVRRELPEERQPRIVALTARALATDREACLEAGMDDVLTKPVRLDTLAQALVLTEKATALH